jgi:hypothetical protein
MDLEQKFNTATALVYTGEDVIQECRGSSIGFHCVTIWNALEQSFSHLAVLQCINYKPYFFTHL